nr:NAD-dependent protein deacetylase [Salsipaludibacter albus]
MSRRHLPDPSAPVATKGSVDELVDLVRDGGVCVLTGAGISTASGIPDYRGVTGRARPATPMRHADFVGSADNRRRYWARSLVGWKTFGDIEPNRGHRAVAALESAGLVDRVITQNVDGLHQSAGSREVVELHGTLATVSCLHCGQQFPRADLQVELRRRNPDFVQRPGTVSADGDAHVADDRSFVVVDCRCGGPLMPDVVFFGAGVPRPVVQRCYRMVEECDALVVLGSSLFVWSGLRFVRHAARHDRPVAIVNHGPTRADELATVRLDDDLTTVLEQVRARLGRPHGAPAAAGASVRP